MNPTLLILAAGIGSRYGGLKQLDEIGPSGEAIIDYSIYDAIRAGFGKVVFVIREDLAGEFKDFLLGNFMGKLTWIMYSRRLIGSQGDIIFQGPSETMGNRSCSNDGCRKDP